MALDIHGIQAVSPPVIEARGERAQHAEEARAALALESARRAAREQVAAESNLGVQLRELAQMTIAFDRRLQFSLNEKLGQVVVKVIDADTDKVIKEIPPAEIQEVHERIREVIGILFDERA
ncbi:MAG: flagellar protein FlaG [Spirochaetia bacterium]|nr:flagellar protein FlaG [Spirochaetia bacterium]